MRVRSPTALFIAFALLFSDCGGSAGPPVTPSKVEPEKFLITYEEARGPGGLPRVLTVHSNGLLELQPGMFTLERKRVPAREIVPVRELVSSPAFAGLKSRYPAPAEEEFDAPTDSLNYRVTVLQGQDLRTVLTDGAENQPAILGRLLNELNRLRSFVEQEGT